MEVPKSDPLYQFRKDVETGKLPAVSWLVPSARLSDHPGSPWYGAWYIAEALSILTKRPDVWRKTIFILTYDENDGYFDHVPPFVAPEPGNPQSGKTSPGIDPSEEYMQLEQDRKRQSEKQARGGPVGLGFRVPLVVASPWSRGGYVCSQVFDHTSVIQLLERIASQRSGKQIRGPNISAWRRTVCGDLTSAFRPFQSGSAATSFPARDSFFEQVHQAQFTRMPDGYRRLSSEDVAQFAKDRFGVSWMPQQEQGVRPSNALAYELAASGAISTDAKRFEVVLEARNSLFGKTAAGAPFHAYTPGTFLNDPRKRTRAYAVAAGERLTDSWDLEGFANRVYNVAICGPNGFLREFAGNAEDPRIDIQCQDVKGDVELNFISRASETLKVQVTDNGYRTGDHTIVLELGQHRQLRMSCVQSHHWYDFSVTIPEHSAFLRRFAGRVETGKSGFSDPVMGRVRL